jgi:hypothetical protein
VICSSATRSRKAALGALAGGEDRDAVRRHAAFGHGGCLDPGEDAELDEEVVAHGCDLRAVFLRRISTHSRQLGRDGALLFCLCDGG